MGYRCLDLGPKMRHALEVSRAATHKQQCEHLSQAGMRQISSTGLLKAPAGMQESFAENVALPLQRQKVLGALLQLTALGHCNLMALPLAVVSSLTVVRRAEDTRSISGA